MNFFKNRKGYILLQAVLLMVLIYTALFLPFNFNLVQHKRNVINDVLDKGLQRAAVEGGVTSSVRNMIVNDLKTRGFAEEDIEVEPGVFEQKNRGETIEITIKVLGYGENLKGVSALGGTPPPEGWKILAQGSIMSEYIP